MSVLRLYFFPLLITIFVCDNSYAQAEPDTLLNKLKNLSNDSARVIALLEIGESIEATTPSKSFTYYQQALTLSKKYKMTGASYLLCMI